MPYKKIELQPNIEYIEEISFADYTKEFYFTINKEIEEFEFFVEPYNTGKNISFETNESDCSDSFVVVRKLSMNGEQSTFNYGVVKVVSYNYIITLIIICVISLIIIN